MWGSFTCYLLWALVVAVPCVFSDGHPALPVSGTAGGSGLLGREMVLQGGAT